MTNAKPLAKPETVCTRFSRMDLSPQSVAEFIDWLCGWERVLDPDAPEGTRDIVETMWGWNAPRQRMGKLLWQLVHENVEDDYFDQNFSYGNPVRTNRTEAVLAPIQERIRWVLQGAFHRQSEDRQIGQGDWGECWWLPKEQTAYVRKQLRKVAVDIVEQQSEYDDSLSYHLNALASKVARSIEVPSRDRTRTYVGIRDLVKHACFVNVLDSDGREFPLRQTSRAYLQREGTGFEWGYGGGGPYSLAECLLTDALDGDYGLCELELVAKFRAAFIEMHPRDQDFRISRQKILKWVEEQGLLGRWKERRTSVAEARRSVAKTIRDAEQRLHHIRRTGGLLAQRFDMVPSTFEAALCLDIVRMLETSDYAMQCSHCKMPISHDGSARANHQRARARRGQPVYHEECRQEQSRLRKKLHWRRKATSGEFRESERRRARLNRDTHKRAETLEEKA